ncbi:MAG: hypothetical protein J6W52_11215 [Bacteroidaceae bacterium]|nr:hypothetical protein [Bacteroidaceae bacterium]
MTNRLSKWSRQSSRMICLMAACGLMYACSDDFVLDDSKPDWLNESIYESLEKSGNFTTYLRLLADKDVNPANARPLTEELSRTGSKTVFVADDAAWEAFFKKNATLPESDPWHYATSYEKLSVAQKKLLIHTSMLNNAIVMENLASSEAKNDNESPTRGEYMRRFTDVSKTDSITYIPSDALPVTYSPVDKDYWERFREQNQGKGIYIISDSSVTMMLHFTQEHMAKNNINSDYDFPKFMGRTRITSDVHIYDAHLDSTDIVCQNGYVNMTEKPLCPLASMADVIRTNGRTKIFSHMLDRFCAPFFNYRITTDYKILHPEFQDSIFTMRYFSQISTGGRALTSEPGDKGTYKKYYPWRYTSEDMPKILKDYAGAQPQTLKFDPAWNEFYADPIHPENRERDMAAMFIPNDSSLWDYFMNAAGNQLIKTYYVREGTEYEIPNEIHPVPYTIPTTYEELYKQIDCIPLGVLEKLINLIMQNSFVGSVPSKMTKLKDDAQEQLFYPDDIEKIDTCLLASNGAVYIMNAVYGPADFTSVTAPAFISTTNKIMNWAIYDQNNMGLNYYAYLKAMQSRFTFFMPSDEGLGYYYDPTSMKSQTPRVIQMSYKNVKDGQVAVSAVCYKYIDPYGINPGTVGTIGDKLVSSAGKINEKDVLNRLKDILESHTIVHDGTNPIDGEDEYFLSKNGNAIKVVRDEEKKIIAAKGGFQLENERQGIGLEATETPGVRSCKVTAPFPNLKNGSTYVLGSPLVPTYRSVYSIFTDDLKETAKYNRRGYSDEAWEENPYSAFYDLCTADATENEAMIEGCGLVSSKLSNSEKNAAKKKFRVFTGDNGLDYNIQFFNNYRYTIFVPSNEAVAEAIENGLPTWEEIYEDYHSHCKHKIDPETGEWEREDNGEYAYTDSLETYEDSIRIQAKITYLTNFIRYHFADNSVFVDRSELSDANGEMVTSSYDHETGLFCKIHVDRVRQGDLAVLRVCDDVTYKKSPNNKIPVTVDDDKYINVLARDVSCNSNPRGYAMTGITLDASSAAVIHRIDGILNHTELPANNRHDSTWSTTANAKKYLKRYAIK